MKKWLLGACAVSGLLLSSSEGFASGWCCTSYCEPACVSYQQVQVQRTVCVPKWVTEKRTVTVCEYKTEAKTQTVTRHRSVPVVRDVPYEYYVSVPVQKVDKVTYHVCVPYTEKVEQTYTTMVPETVQQTATRRLCKYVPVVTKAYRTVDQGHWVDQVCNYTVCCGGSCCAPCYQTICSTHKVWQPNCVQVAYDVTTQRCEYYEEPYTYNVTVCKPVVTKQLVDVTRYRNEARVRDVTYTVCSYQKQVGSRKVTEYTTEAYQDTVTYHVQVPVHVQKTYDVQVCTYEHQVVTETVNVPCYSQPAYHQSGCNTGGYGHGGHGHGCFSFGCCGW